MLAGAQPFRGGEQGLVCTCEATPTITMLENPTNFLTIQLQAH